MYVPMQISRLPSVNLWPTVRQPVFAKRCTHITAVLLYFDSFILPRSVQTGSHDV